VIHQPELVIGVCIRGRALSKARSERSPLADAATTGPAFCSDGFGEGCPSWRSQAARTEDASVEERPAPAQPSQSGRAVRPFVEARDASARSIYLMTWWIARVRGSAVRSAGGPNQSASAGAFLRPAQRMGEDRNLLGIRGR
jgi:hypothetical protein